MKRYTRGFTLIELLVVIAIIGILSSVVLVSLSSARSKGKAASAISSMNSMRSAAELTVDSSGKYSTTLCTAATGELATLRAAVNAQTGKTTACNLGTDYLAWAAEIDMTSVGGALGTSFFCVDSAGFAGNKSATIGAATKCN